MWAFRPRLLSRPERDRGGFWSTAPPPPPPPGVEGIREKRGGAGEPYQAEKKIVFGKRLCRHVGPGCFVSQTAVPAYNYNYNNTYTCFEKKLWDNAN